MVENAADQLHFNVVHGVDFFPSIFYKIPILKSITNMITSEWDFSESSLDFKDRYYSHKFHLYFYICGRKYLIANIDLRPSIATNFSEFIFFGNFRIIFIAYIITTASLRQRLVTHVYLKHSRLNSIISMLFAMTIKQIVSTNHINYALKIN